MHQDALARQTLALTHVLGFIAGGYLRGMPPIPAVEEDRQDRRPIYLVLAFVAVLLVLTYRAMLLNPTGGG